MGSEWMKIPKTDRLLKFKKAKKFISLDSRFVDLGFPAIIYKLDDCDKHVRETVNDHSTSKVLGHSKPYFNLCTVMVEMPVI